MRGVACLVGVLALLVGCVLENQPVQDAGSGGSGGSGGDAGPCGGCPPDKPVCNDELQCVECTSKDSYYCAEQELLCDVESSECVACLLDADCTNVDAAKCDPDDKECVRCDSHDQCDGVEGLAAQDNACNANGVCVQCTPETEQVSCGGTSCDPANETCTQTQVGSRDVCESCVADSECGIDGAPSDEYRCVLMYYRGEPFPDQQTGFCLKTTAGGCEQPFSITLVGRPSLSEPTVEANYCGINENLATCPAVNALLGNQRCPSGAAQECPQPSGLCERVGDLENRCTYPCGLPVQCPADPPADTCGSSNGTGGSGGTGDEDYCGG
jgi:hypothetical protein